MEKKDPRVDAYIEKAAPFARPILKRLREAVHSGCPVIEETIKWQMPFFEHKGPLCFMAAFKKHCAFGFWKGRRIFGEEKTENEAMGQFGRIESITDLPNDKLLIGYVRKAAALSEAEIKSAPPRRSPEKRKLVLPADLKTALRKNPKAQKAFENFSYTHKREYAEWIAGAKRAETRERRLKTAIQWIGQGKPQNWKYI
jgi:uncharacterized protein YdeI (YjbR/CyaY-like superfamily)